MEILVPINQLTYLEDYLQAGAKEFYMGFYDDEWTKQFGKYADLNRMSGYQNLANSHSFEELLKVIARLKRKNAAPFVTFNAASYSQEKLYRLEHYLERLCEVAPSGIIVSSPELVRIVKKYHLSPVVSTIAGVYNEEIASYYAELGVKRIILPRDLTLREIEEIVGKNRDMEYEVFLMRNGCKFSDGYCLGFHRKEMCSVCAELDRAESRFLFMEASPSFEERSTLWDTDRRFKNSFHEYSCGLCAIFDFLSMGVSAVKVVGRSDDNKAVCEDIRLIGQNIKIANNCNSREEYLAKMRFPAEYTEMCTDSYSCYYPELRF